MLPPNIDLTEHRDFGKFIGNLVIPIAFNDTEIMTSDDYENICRYESIFGKKMRNQAHKMLGDVYDLPFPIDWNRTCVRCGKPLLPWNNLGGICRECDKELNQSYGFGGFPWQMYNTPINSSSVMDIFNLR